MREEKEAAFVLAPGKPLVRGRTTAAPGSAAE
jgi:hypothetical protein